MKLICLILFVVFIKISCISQSIDNIRNKVELSLRAKALAFIEDIGCTTASLGGEFKINPHFSLVADYVHFKWFYEREVYATPGSETYSEYAQNDKRKYVAIELRYYPNLQDLQGVYYTTLSKIGNRSWTSEDKFPLQANDVYYLQSKLTDLGG